MSKAWKQSSTPVKEMAELTIAELSAVTGGRLRAQLNAGGVNPLVVARDKALNSG